MYIGTYSIVGIDSINPLTLSHYSRSDHPVAVVPTTHPIGASVLRGPKGPDPDDEFVDWLSGGCAGEPQ